MEVSFVLSGWQFSLALARLRKSYLDLKLPTLEEINQMRKEAYRRFREALKKKKESEQFEAMAHHRCAYGTPSAS